MTRASCVVTRESWLVSRDCYLCDICWSAAARAGPWVGKWSQSQIKTQVLQLLASQQFSDSDVCNVTFVMQWVFCWHALIALWNFRSYLLIGLWASRKWYMKYRNQGRRTASRILEGLETDFLEIPSWSYGSLELPKTKRDSMELLALARELGPALIFRISDPILEILRYC